jgi:hypothetical protein
MNISIATDTDVAQEFDALGLEMDTEEPYLIFQNLSLKETEELHKDIQLYLGLESDEKNKEFWQSMLLVCDDELSRQRTLAATGGQLNKAAEGVEKEIAAMLSGKSFEQLNTIQKQVERRLSGQDGPVDIEFWEAVLKALVVWKAKARLRDMHRFLLSKRLEQLKNQATEEKNGEREADAKPVLKLNSSLLTATTDNDAASAKAEQAMAELKAQADYDDYEDAGRSMEEEAENMYDGSMSPRLVDELGREDKGWEVVDEEEDFEKLVSLFGKLNRACN